MQVDWFRVITDIERSGMTQQKIARHVIASKSTVAYWKQGNEPRYCDGERLIRLWELVTRRSADDLPYMHYDTHRYRLR